MPLTDYFTSGTQKTFRRTGADMNSTSRLQDMQFFDRFQHDIGYFAYSVATIGFHASDIQVGEIVVCSAFLSGNTDFRGSRMVVYLDKETRHQLFGFGTGKCPGCYFLLIERCQMLIEMPRIHGIPPV